MLPLVSWRSTRAWSSLRRHDPTLLTVLVLTSLATGVVAQSEPADVEWRHHGRDRSFSRYAPLDQIDAGNFPQLEVAWRWKSADHSIRETPGSFTGSALMISGRVYMMTAMWQLAALDAATGEELWVYDPKSYELPKAGYGNPRGIEYWTDGVEERILFATVGKQLISIDLATGLPDPTFGEDGIVDMSRDLLGRKEILIKNISAGSPGIVVGDTYVVGSRIFDGPLRKHNIPPGHVRAYDVRTGEQKWRFNTIPEQGEDFTETWEDDSWKWMGNTNVWAPLAADEELGYVYFATSTPSSDYWGGDRHGDNVYAESVVCVEAETGKRVWHFQTVHHGIWDYDIASAPNVLDVVIDGRLRKVVAVVSKTAFAYIFDRVTGEPIWPIEERPVAPSTVPGEKLSPTQPFPTKPPAFDQQGVTYDDLIDFTPELRAEALELIEDFVIGPIFTPTILAGEGGKLGTIVMPSAGGGANHPGASHDPVTGVLYVQSTTQAGAWGLGESDPARSDFRYVKKHAPLKSGTEYSLFGAAVQGLPLLKPPYRRITAIDLKTGEHAWQAPLGEGPTDHPAISHLNLGYLGSRISSGTREGGLLVTKTLVITHVPKWESWDAPTANGSYLTAYDKATGKVLAELETDMTLHGVPISYRHRGRQYIVVPGGGKPGGRALMGRGREGQAVEAEPAELIAFALPDGR